VRNSGIPTAGATRPTAADVESARRALSALNARTLVVAAMSAPGADHHLLKGCSRALAALSGTRRRALRPRSARRRRGSAAGGGGAEEPRPRARAPTPSLPHRPPALQASRRACPSLPQTTSTRHFGTSWQHSSVSRPPPLRRGRHRRQWRQRRRHDGECVTMSPSNLTAATADGGQRRRRIGGRPGVALTPRLCAPQRGPAVPPPCDKPPLGRPLARGQRLRVGWVGG
jgi:hypothetical protein